VLHFDSKEKPAGEHDVFCDKGFILFAYNKLCRNNFLFGFFNLNYVQKKERIQWLNK